jgi:hypothetical protein
MIFADESTDSAILGDLAFEGRALDQGNHLFRILKDLGQRINRHQIAFGPDGLDPQIG